MPLPRQSVGKDDEGKSRSRVERDQRGKHIKSPANACLKHSAIAAYMPSTTEPTAHPRGRTAVAKPLAASTVAATTASTRAKQAPAGSSEKKPIRPLKEPVATATAAPKKPSRRPEPSSASAKSRNLQSSTSRSSVKKEPLKESIPKDEKKTDPRDDHTEDSAEAVRDNIGNPPVEQEESNTEASKEQDSVQPVSQPQTERDTESIGLPPTSDPLQVAAQTYPWLYMTSTLEACFSGAEKTAQKELDEHEEQLEEDETQLADEKLRYDSERMIEFCDQLESDMFSKDAPAIMQSFISHGEECTRIEAEALQLVATTPSLDSEEPLRAYNTMLDHLDQLQEQASELESSILRLTESQKGPYLYYPESPARKGADEEEERANEETGDVNSARAQIIGVFAACLPVLRARIANLTMAQELIDSAQENLSLALRMESMGIE